MTVSVVLEYAGAGGAPRRRCRATHSGRPPRNKGMRYAPSGRGRALLLYKGKAVAARSGFPCSAKAGMAPLARATVGGVRLVDAGGEQAEIVGQGAVGELGDACAQDGDRLGR